MLRLVTALSGINTAAYEPRLASALARTLRAEVSSDVNLARVAAEQLRHWHAGGDPEILATAGPKLFADPLCLALLGHALNVDGGLELAATRQRRTLLKSAVQRNWGPGAALFRPLRLLRRALGQSTGNALSGNDAEIATALALQGYENDYVQLEEGDETRVVSILHRALEGVDWGTALSSGDETRLLLYAMYRPLAGLACAREILNAPTRAPVATLIEQTLAPPIAAAQHQPAIERAGALEDETTRTVRAQYESNPYPRWRIYPTSDPIPLAEYVRVRFPGLRSPVLKATAKQMLIAGCGTGQQAISSARRFPDTSITATDLALSSLGYAQYMARRLGVESIRFVQNDVLEVDALDTRFDIIECVGVLHHLSEPQRGLGALSSVLAPGGLMRLGLYSEIARRPIASAQARIRDQRVEATPDGMRAYRRRIMLGQEPELVWEVMRYHDFYNLNEFRDMLFHVMEHRFSLSDIHKLLCSCGLELLGIEPPSDAVAQHYAARYPDDRSFADFHRWAAYEREHPETFRRMVIIWCRKPE